MAIAFMVGVGSRYESEAESGISHFVEHMVFKGGRRFPTARDVSEAIEGVGGVL
ncbi:MAG: insulinase family protein, partial [Candidatus Dormiibacterota bacterium]